MNYIDRYNSEFSVALRQIMSSEVIGFDIESTSLNPRKGTLLTIQVATPENVWVFDARKLNLKPLMDHLKNYKGLVIIQNGKFDLQYIYDKFGFWWQANFYDPFIAHRLKNVGIARTYKDKFVGLDRLVKGYLQTDINKEVRESFQYVEDNELTSSQLQYAAEDASVLIPLWNAMQPRCANRQSETIYKLEFDLLPITASLEYNGVKLDTNYWTKIADEKASKRQELYDKIVDIFSEYIDWDINLNSWQQLLKAFKLMGFNLPNTQAATIAKHKNDHEVFKLLSEYKIMQKAVSTYGHGYLDHVAGDGRIYAEFNQVGTDTGRWSCSSPNLQQIPVRADDRYRKAFIAEDGNLIITSDLCLHPRTKILTADLKWIEALEVKEGMELVGIDEDLPDKRGRRIRKTIVEKVSTRVAPSYLIIMEDDTEIIASEEHPWLAKKWPSSLSGPYIWRKTKDLVVGDGIAKFVDVWEDKWHRQGYKKVKSIEFIGDVELVSIQTSTNTFVAEGLFTHNSQIEYRLAGEFANSEVIITEYNKKEPDFHQLAADQAAKALGHPVKRSVGKTMNFALIYQAYYKKLTDVLECTDKEAKQLYDAYWTGFSDLKDYMKQKGYETLVKGYTETFWGRRRYFDIPPDTRKNYWRRQAIKREGGNHPIQGSAADLLKKAMLYMFPQLHNLNSRLIHTVHDEVVVECPSNAEVVDECQYIIENSFIRAGSEIMERVPTKVDTNIESHWTK